MRPGLACAAFLLAAFIPAATSLAQHHGVVVAPVHGHGIVAMAHPGVIGHGGGSPGAQGPIVNETIVNNTYDYSPSYYNRAGGYGGYGYGGYGGYGYGYGGLRFGGLGYGGLGYGGLGYGGLGYGGLGYYGMGMPYGYGFYGLPYGGLYAFAPGATVLPTGALFGPQPIQQMLAGAGMPPFDPGPLGGQAAPRERKVRVSNAEAKARAGKLIDQGDKLFGNQRFREALEHYKSAVIQAPDMAEIFLRQGFALIAIGQYESAGKAMRRGLKMQSAWTPDELSLDRLYGPEKVAKTAHVEALAVALKKSPHDATALYLTGMELFFAGQVERSRPFFIRAGQLGANDEHLLDGFLSATAAAAAQRAAAQGAAQGAGAAPGAAAQGAKPLDRGPILDF